MESRLRRADTRRFKEAIKIITSISGEQARFALLLTNQKLRGYLMMPEWQKSFLADLRRALKARPRKEEEL